MRVLLVTKFYYPRGGDCVVAMNTERLLRDHGHEVEIFAMQHPMNVASDCSDHFARQVTFDGNLSSRIDALRRALGQGDINTAVQRALDDFKPQVVLLHNIHSYLSPLIAREAHRRGCRVLWTMHDYKLFCPAYSCLRPDGTICDLCATGGAFNVVKHRCMKGSLAASAAGWLEARKWNRKNILQWVDGFLCPSEFMARKMTETGFPAEKVHHLPNFVTQTELEALRQPVAPRDDYYCYVGRLSQEKGVDWLLQAASRLPHTLKVAGEGPQADELKSRYADCANIEFMGRQGRPQVINLLRHARLTVVPSLWWENNPMSIIESLCAGTPAVGTDLGGIPELLSPDNGIIVEPTGDTITLAQAIQTAWNTTWQHEQISAQAAERFNAETHYNMLEKLMSYNLYGLKGL